MEARIIISGSLTAGFDINIYLPVEFLSKFSAQTRFIVAEDELCTAWGSFEGDNVNVRVRSCSCAGLPAARDIAARLEAEVLLALDAVSEPMVEETFVVPLQ